MAAPSQLARQLQTYCVLLGAVAVAWLAWRWRDSPLQATAGAAAVLFGGPIVLGIEFFFLRWLGGSPQVPRPSAGQLVRAWGSESVHFFQTFCWRQPFRWDSVPDRIEAAPGTTGVVLVHGFFCNRGFWTPWLRRLAAERIPTVTVNLEPIFGSIDDYAPTLADAISRMRAATGRAPIVVCHSMGGLAFRAWWRASGKPGDVQHVITIATPHHGTWLGRFSRRPNGRQMRLASDWLAGLEQHESAVRPLPPLTCWYSNCDNIVFPCATAMHGHAQSNRFVPGQPHVALAFHPDVLAHCIAQVRGAGVKVN
ncbi:alpha/beta fold hydrolase [Ramlibacter sp. PS3R-8]|uniref:esterase/lipase family protein n=1 Tax=Ramlibacter sp. PS3R-8 TaxID=3133437 RepID=UPI0030A22E7B